MLVPVPDSDDACDVDQEVDLYRERIAEGCAGRAQRCASFCEVHVLEVWQFSKETSISLAEILEAREAFVTGTAAAVRARSPHEIKSDQVGSSRIKPSKARELCLSF